MKKILLAILFFANTLFLTAQTPKVKPKTSPKVSIFVAAPECIEFIKLIDAANADQLKLFETKPVTSKYYKSLDLFASSLNLPNVIESYIKDDNRSGTSYHAFLKNYGDDEKAAKADFTVLVNKFSDCLEKKDVSYTSDLTTAFIVYKKARIELHYFRSGNVNAWVSNIKIAYDKLF